MVAGDREKITTWLNKNYSGREKKVCLVSLVLNIYYEQVITSTGCYQLPKYQCTNVHP